MDYEALFSQFTESNLHGRYITNQHIEPLLERDSIGKVDKIGLSVQKKPIFQIFFGTGKTKILFWSQMHGNESTATKALFDLFNFLNSDHEAAKNILEKYSLCFIPILNPDGAKNYTRENADGADLNRDFTLFTQPESKILFDAFMRFKPEYCFNLHDQRTIFGAGNTGFPATISFLAPAFDDERNYNESRKRAVCVINTMNEVLQNLIPNQVGRFDDKFNLNCAGDRFQSESAATILIEAGHFANDYNREITRKYFFISLVAALQADSEADFNDSDIQEYLNIPQNKIVFYDFVYKNIRINYDGIEIITNFASQFKEVLLGDEIVFQAVVTAIGNLNNYFGHFEFDAKGAKFSDAFGNEPVIDRAANFFIGDIEFINGKPTSLSQ